MKNWSVEIDTTEGYFNVSRTMRIFHNHATEVELKGELKALREIIKTNYKRNRVMLTMSSFGDSYGHHEIGDRIIVESPYGGEWELDYRTYNGRDYSDSKVYTFLSESEMLKYVMKLIEADIRKAITDIPQEKSRYAASL